MRYILFSLILAMQLHIGQMLHVAEKIAQRMTITLMGHAVYVSYHTGCMHGPPHGVHHALGLGDWLVFGQEYVPKQTTSALLPFLPWMVPHHRAPQVAYTISKRADSFW